MASKRICFEKVLSEFFSDFVRYPYLNERQKHNHKTKLTQVITLYKALLDDEKYVINLISESARDVSHSGGQDTKATRTAEYKYNLMKQLPQFYRNYINNYFSKDSGFRDEFEKFV